jgi:small GTP-binding protein
MIRYAAYTSRRVSSAVHKNSVALPLQTYWRANSTFEDEGIEGNGFDEPRRNRARRSGFHDAHDRRPKQPVIDNTANQGHSSQLRSRNGEIMSPRNHQNQRDQIHPQQYLHTRPSPQERDGHKSQGEAQKTSRLQNNTMKPPPDSHRIYGKSKPPSPDRDWEEQRRSEQASISHAEGTPRNAVWRQSLLKQRELFGNTSLLEQLDRKSLTDDRLSLSPESQVATNTTRSAKEETERFTTPWRPQINFSSEQRDGKQNHNEPHKTTWRENAAMKRPTDSHGFSDASRHPSPDRFQERQRKQASISNVKNFPQNTVQHKSMLKQQEVPGRTSLLELLHKRSLSKGLLNLSPNENIASSQDTKTVSERLEPSWKPRLDMIKEQQGNQDTITISPFLATVQSVSEKVNRPREGMTDVSDLRNAFLRRDETEKNRKRQAEALRIAVAVDIPEEGFGHHPVTQLWRAPNGAREYREKLIARKEAEENAPVQASAKEPDLGAVNLVVRMANETQKKKEEAAKKRRKHIFSNRKEGTSVQLPGNDLTVHEFSLILRVNEDIILSVLRQLGESPEGGGSSLVDIDTMELVTLELGLEPIRSKRRATKSISEEDREILLQRRAAGESIDDKLLAKYEALPQRPPVVCLMGHVDHGKTTLMDALRRRSSSSDSHQKAKAKLMQAKTANKNASVDDVAGTEAGGITQSISAFQVRLDDKGAAVTFLDTPGHAAFRAMRESGSHAADVIVLVIAADDGVSRQTIEILDFFKSIVTGTGGGGISLVVAMTKIDKPGIDVAKSQRRIENQLLEHGILTETFGGEGEYGPPVQLLPVSGITGEGLDELIEGLSLQTEIMDLRADPDARAEGIIMDARLDKSLGVVADCIIRWGSIERGDIVVSGIHMGKIKVLKDPSDTVIQRGGPSQPVRVIGFKSTPKAGDPIVVVESEDKAHTLIARREAMQSVDPGHEEDRPDHDKTGAIEIQISGISAQRPHMLARLFNKHGIDANALSTQIRIPVVLKADANGTLAALKDSIVSIGQESKFDVVIDPIVTGVGQLTQADVLSASGARAAVFCFNLKPSDGKVMALIDDEKVVFKNHNVIYTLIDDAKKIFSSYLPSRAVYHIHGKAKVQAVFEINNKSDAEKIAGLMVEEGTLFTKKTTHPNGVGTIDCYYRVKRAGELISPLGESIQCSSLRRVREIVETARFGQECGLGLTGFDQFEAGDTIECYSVEMQQDSF